MQTLRLGSKGSDVMAVQEALNARMTPPNNTLTRPALDALVVDGDFGSRTKAMVVEFQRLNGLVYDGIVGKDTSFLLLPFIAFSGVLRGHGLIVGRGSPNVQVAPSVAGLATLAGLTSGRFPFMSTPGVISITQDPDFVPTPQPEALTLDLTITQGGKREFTPWFVLKPEEPEGAKAFTTVSVEGTILRKKGFEFGGELEFSRQVVANGERGWEWEATLFGKYQVSKEIGPVTVGLGPIVEASVKAGLKTEVSAGGEAEVSISLVKDTLDLAVGGKVAGQWAIQEGNVQAGAEIGAGLKLRWDIVRLPGRR